MSAASTVMQRIEALARISDDPHCLTRTFCSPAMRGANDLVAGWMRSAGLTVREDAIGNLIGHQPADSARAKTLLLGSHLDTVRGAGRFDGPLGVLVALACVDELRKRRVQLPFALEVIGFSDEEGVRYQSAYLGSKAMAGALAESDLRRVDASGIAMRDAIRQFGGDPENLRQARKHQNELLGYIEVHIEQGPVLESRDLGLGIVSGIAGQTRSRWMFTGRAGHAGTTPMRQRRDALCAAAEFIVAVERFAKQQSALVATVGQLAIKPGASNVIPAAAELTLDVRHLEDSRRKQADRALHQMAEIIGKKRSIRVGREVVQSTPAVPCSPLLSERLRKSVERIQGASMTLPSGAGHDAAIMASVTEVAMLFVRCKGGISHSPLESVRQSDVRLAIAALTDFIEHLEERS